MRLDKEWDNSKLDLGKLLKERIYNHEHMIECNLIHLFTSVITKQNHALTNVSKQ